MKLKLFLIATISTVVCFLNASISIERKESDLAGVVGRPFAYGEKYSFHIDSSNSKCESVGTAYFKNSNPKIGNAEKIAWYWSPENGFKIIASQNELISFYESSFISFQFYKLHINENGVVTGSFLIDQVPGPGVVNRCPWFWWSTDTGIHLSAKPTQYQLVENINNHDQVIINVLTQENESNSAIIVDIHHPDLIRYVEFPYKEINDLVNATWKETFKFRYWLARIIGEPQITKAIQAKEINDNCMVSGEARICVTFKYKIENRIYLFSKVFVISFKETEIGSWENLIEDIIDIND